jgi:hypothetical protein
VYEVRAPPSAISAPAAARDAVGNGNGRKDVASGREDERVSVAGEIEKCVAVVGKADARKVVR